MSAPDPDPGPPTATPRRVLRFGGALLRPRARALALVTALFGAETLTSVLGPVLLGAIVDVVVEAGSPGRIDVLAAAYVAATVGSAALSWLAAVQAASVSETVLADLREQTFDQVVDLPLATVEKFSAGHLLSRLGDDVAVLSEAVRDAVPSVALEVATIVFTVGALMLLSPLLAAAALVGLPISVMAGRRYQQWSPSIYRRDREWTGRVVARLHEAVEGVRTIRSLRREAVHVAHVRQAGEARLDVARDGIRARNRLRLALYAAQYSGLTAVLGAGAVLVARDQASVGTITAAALYALNLADAVGCVAEQLDELQLAGASLARIVGLLDLDTDRRDGSAQAAGTQVRLRGVCFSYRPGCEVLHEVDLDVVPGEWLAMVGPSGAGKTTLAKLIAGMHLPTGGTVTIGGADLSRVDREPLRRLVALVPQETHVFAGTVADNLRLARPAASDAQLWDAIDAVGATRWAEQLPDGLGTTVGSGVRPLSPGQAQKLALARVVLADPGIVILDEATASLDRSTAGPVERAVAAALSGRTVIAIAHGLSATPAADRVIFVEGGRIVESGSHSELLALGGAYASLWNTWAASHLEDGRGEENPGPGANPRAPVRP